MQLIVTTTYERAIRKLIAEDARERMEAQIVANPADAPVIPGTGGIRKLRWAGSGRGKRGGIRTIYYYHADPAAVYLPMACAKADREDMKLADNKDTVAAGGGDKEGRNEMSAERTQLGLEVEAALNEVLSHVRGETELPCRVTADPPAERVRALRKRMAEPAEIRRAFRSRRAHRA